MIWMTLASTSLAAFGAQPGPASADGLFTAAEVRTMCRGESGEDARFRTQAGYALLAEYQRSRCRMYLLGLADGMGQRNACPPAANERQALGDRLVAAVLEPPASPGRSISQIVSDVLRSGQSCR